MAGVKRGFKRKERKREGKQYFIKDKWIEIDFSFTDDIITSEEREKFLKDNPFIVKPDGGKSSLQSFFDKYGKRQDQKKSNFIKYCHAVNLTPQELYSLKLGEGATYAEELLSAFQTEGELKKGKGDSRIDHITTVVKSFYNFFGLPLVRGRSVWKWRRKPQSKRQFNKEDLLVFVEKEPIQVQTMVAVLSTLPVRVDAFSKFKWKEVKQVLKGKELPQIIVPYEYQKESIADLEIYQTSFVHNWAKEMLLKWKDEYQKITKRKIDVNDPKSLENPLWCVEYQRPHVPPSPASIERYFRDASKNSGIKINPKDLRMFFNTCLRTEDTDLKSIFMGQSGRYNQAYIMEGHNLWENLKEIFLKTQPHIDPRFEAEVEDKRARVREIWKKTGFTDEQIEEFEKAFTQGFISGSSDYYELVH